MTARAFGSKCGGRGSRSYSGRARAGSSPYRSLCKSDAIAAPYTPPATCSKKLRRENAGVEEVEEVERILDRKSLRLFDPFDPFDPFDLSSVDIEKLRRIQECVAKG